MLIILSLSFSVWCEYIPQGPNSIFLKINSLVDFQNLDQYDVFVNNVFSLGGYFDFGWAYFYQNTMGSQKKGFSVSLKGVILSQSATIPLNLELSGLYGLFYQDGNLGYFYQIDTAYYRDIKFDGLYFKIGSVIRYYGTMDYVENLISYHNNLYYGGIFGVGISFGPHLLFALDNRLYLDNSIQVLWEPELVFAITLKE